MREAAMLGVLLAGGRSSRFGTNKALAPVDGQAMSRHVADALLRVCGPDNVVVLAHDAAPYGFLNLPVVLDETPHQGPAVALCRALPRLPVAPLLLVCPCDMPWVTPGLFAALLEGVGQASACVATGATGGLSPLPGVYRAGALQAFVQSPPHSLKALLAGLDDVAALDRATLLEQAGHPLALENINRPQDLPGEETSF